jgi:hypothetical protein
MHQLAVLSTEVGVKWDLAQSGSFSSFFADDHGIFVFFF